MDSKYYIKGVLDGDGYIMRCNKNPRISLEVKSRKFAMKFAKALNDIGLIPRITERDEHRENCRVSNRLKAYTYDLHRYMVRATCREIIVDEIMNLELATDEQKISYIQGVFDSDGCHCIYKKPYAFIGFYNIKRQFLEFVRNLLHELKIITSGIYKGTSTYMLIIYRQKQVKRFLTIIGSKFHTQ